MIERSLLSRITGLAYLVLALTLSGVLPAAEAREQGSAPASHVEAPGETGCPPVHEHWNCNICRVSRLMARGEHPSPWASQTSAPLAPGTARLQAFGRQRLGSAWLSRAPPAV